MSEGGIENRKGLLSRIKDKFSPNIGKARSTHGAELRDIGERHRESLTQVKSLNELQQFQAQMSSEVTEVTSRAMFESLKGLSSEAVEVLLERMAEDAQAGYEQAHKSNINKQRAISEVNLRIASATQKLFNENRDQFRSASEYIKDLSPEERTSELIVLEEQANASKKKFEKTKKPQDLDESRLSSKVLRSARDLIAGNGIDRK